MSEIIPVNQETIELNQETIEPDKQQKTLNIIPVSQEFSDYIWKRYRREKEETKTKCQRSY